MALRTKVRSTASFVISPARLILLVVCAFPVSGKRLNSYDECGTTSYGNGNTAVNVEVGCNASSIDLTMVFPADDPLLVFLWLEYECNGTIMPVMTPEDSSWLQKNYRQKFEPDPLPDGTNCTARGCFMKFADFSYLFNITRNCTIEIDECAEGMHDCGNNTECIDTVGDYECNCSEGYFPVGDGINCFLPPAEPSPEPDGSGSGDEGETNLAVRVTLPLILLLLLAAAAVAVAVYIARRRHGRERTRFRHYKFDVESKLDVSYDPGVLKLDARFTVHSSLGSVLHELSYEQDIQYTTTPTEASAKEKMAKNGGEIAADTDSREEEGGGGDETSLGSGERGGRGRENQTPLQLPVGGGGGGGGGDDSNSCLLSPTSIAMELSSNDSNCTSEGSHTLLPLRQSCGDAHSTGYVSETVNGWLGNTSGHSNRASHTTNEEEEAPVFEAVNDPAPGTVPRSTGGVEKPCSSGYVCGNEGRGDAASFSGHAAAPHASSEEDYGLPPTDNRILSSHYTPDSSAGTASPCSGVGTATTTTTVRDGAQQQQQIVHVEQEHSKQKQQQQQQQRERDEAVQRTESSLSLNIITDLEQAFPLSCRFPSGESLNYLPDTLPQLMPTRPDSRSLGYYSSPGGCGLGRSAAGYVADSTSGIFVENSKPGDAVISDPSSLSYSTGDIGGSVLTCRTEPALTPHHTSLSRNLNPIHITHSSNFPTTKPVISLSPETSAHTRLLPPPHSTAGLSGGYVNLEQEPSHVSSVLPATSSDIIADESTSHSSMDAATTPSVADGCRVTMSSRTCGVLLPGNSLEDLREEGESGFHNILFRLEACHDDYI